MVGTIIMHVIAKETEQQRVKLENLPKNQK